MALSAANILLEITGDASDGEKTLADFSRDLAIFAREEAEAAAFVDTGDAEAELDELKVKLSEIDGKDVSADVNVKIAAAQAHLAEIQAKLDHLDHEDVTVDVNVKRGLATDIGSLAREIEGLGKDIESTGKSSSIFSGLLGSLGQGFEVLPPLAKAVAVAVAVALAGALAALVASLAEAVAGVGALAVAFGSTLLPAVGLAVGAIARFKEQSGTAGTAAYALKEAAGKLFETFKGATAGGADAVFRGLSAAMRDLDLMVKSLGPAFTKLGQAGGDAFRALGKEFSSPAWQHFFTFITESLTELTPLFTRSFGALARILANIAQASMPYLIKGFEAIADGLESLAKGSSNISSLRSDIGGLVGQLKAWLDLTKAVGGAFLAFVSAAAPQGKGLVEWLTKGAEAFASWERSKSGREAIRSFFKDVLPVVKELITGMLRLGVIAAQTLQFFSPLIAALLHDFNAVLKIISEVITWLTKLDRALTLEKTWSALKSAATDSWNWVKNAATDAWDATVGAAERAWNEVKSTISSRIQFVIGFADDIASLARGIWNHVKDAITDTIKFVIGFASDIASRARNIWSAVKGTVTDVIHFVFGLPGDMAARARNIWSAVKGVISDVVNFIFSLPGEIVGRARDLWNSVKGVITDAISFALSLPGGIVAAAKKLWDDVKNAVSGGINLVIHLVPDISGLPGKVASVLGFANGVRDLMQSTFALVGERGPELAFLPQGTDIYTAGETRNILKALGRGALAPVAGSDSSSAPSGGGKAEHNEYNLSVVAPGTGSPDPDITLALWNAKLRAQGVLA